jgi:type VI protein secretion system component Hcp
MPGRRHFVATLVLVCALGTASNAFAQRAFLFIPNIPGDATVEGYVDWINVLSIRQTATSSSRRSIACDLSVVKNIDVAGPALWAAAAGGTIVPEMMITVLNNSPEPIKLYDIRLANVRIGAVQATTGTADASETVTLVPQGVTLTYYTQTPTGGVGSPVTQSFSCQ